MGKIVSVNELLEMEVNIPNYQRPYKWSKKNVSELLEDIDAAIIDSSCQKYENFKYRLGSIILHKKNKDDGNFDIVDGQQRLITLSLIKCVIDPEFSSSLLQHKFNDKDSILNINENYKYIVKHLKSDTSKIEDYKKAFSNILEVVILEVKDVSEAFQLFDSQNTRGKELEPHDLLKAYHLRKIKEETDENIKDLVTTWEDKKPSDIKNLFSIYLYPIYMWSRKEKSHTFKTEDIDTYKGVDDNWNYNYVNYVRKTMPNYLIHETFISGSDFFNFVNKYINKVEEIKNEVASNPKYSNVKEIISCFTKKHKSKSSISDTEYSSTGFKYAMNLFYCVLLLYVDKFNEPDETIINKLFTWVMMVRIDKRYLGMETINNYAIGNEGKDYTNTIPMFYKIATARDDREIRSLQISIKENAKKSDSWKYLYDQLNKLNGGFNLK